MKILLLIGLLLAPGAVMAQSEVCNSSFTVNTVGTLRLYCIGTGTNITSKVALTQCK